MMAWQEVLFERRQQLAEQEAKERAERAARRAAPDEVRQIVAPLLRRLGEPERGHEADLPILNLAAMHVRITAALALTTQAVEPLRSALRQQLVPILEELDLFLSTTEGAPPRE